MAGPVTGTCVDCGQLGELRRGSCFPCRIRTVGFTFRGAHTGKASWHEATVMGEKAEIYREARETGVDMERAH